MADPRQSTILDILDRIKWNSKPSPTPPPPSPPEKKQGEGARRTKRVNWWKGGLNFPLRECSLVVFGGEGGDLA